MLAPTLLIFQGNNLRARVGYEGGRSRAFPGGVSLNQSTYTVNTRPRTGPADADPPELTNAWISRPPYRILRSGGPTSYLSRCTKGSRRVSTSPTALRSPCTHIAVARHETAPPRGRNGPQVTLFFGTSRRPYLATHSDRYHGRRNDCASTTLGTCSLQ